MSDSPRRPKTRGAAAKGFRKPRQQTQGGGSSSAQPTGYRPDFDPPPQFQHQFYNPSIPYTQLLQSFDPYQTDNFTGSVNYGTQNYRDITRDDTASDEETQDLGFAEEEEEDEEVEEVEEPRRKGRGKATGKAKAQRWADHEEVALASAFVSCSEDPDQSNERTKDGFWRMVTEHVAATLGHEKRTLDQCYSKWRDLNKAMKKWNGFYQTRANLMRPSGASDEDVMAQAMADYKNNCRSKGFPHVSAWRVVRNHSCWAPIPGMGAESQQSKRSKSNDEGHYATSSDAHNTFDDAQPFEPARPVRKPKSKLGTSSDSHAEILEQIQQFNQMNQEDVDHRKKYREEKMRRADLEFITNSHAHLSGPMLEIVLQEKREKAARWGWEFPY